jgi:hypothetical protein
MLLNIFKQQNVYSRWVQLLFKASLAIRETILRFHFTPVRMAIIKKTNKNWPGWVEKTLIHCWWEYKLVWPLQKLV